VDTFVIFKGDNRNAAGKLAQDFAKSVGGNRHALLFDVRERRLFGG